MFVSVLRFDSFTQICVHFIFPLHSESWINNYTKFVISICFDSFLSFTSSTYLTMRSRVYRVGLVGTPSPPLLGPLLNLETIVGKHYWNENTENLLLLNPEGIIRTIVRMQIFDELSLSAVKYESILLKIYSMLHFDFQNAVYFNLNY